MLRQAVFAGRERGSVRRSRVVLAPRPWRYVGGKFAADNGGKKGRFPGESAYKPSNHCAGKAGMSRLYLSNPCAFFRYVQHTAMRAQSAPGFPCALFKKREQRDATTRTKTSRGNALGCLKIESANSLSSRASEARPGTHNHRTRFCEGWSSSLFPATRPCGYGSRLSPGRH